MNGKHDGTTDRRLPWHDDDPTDHPMPWPTPGTAVTSIQPREVESVGTHTFTLMGVHLPEGLQVKFFRPRAQRPVMGVVNTQSATDEAIEVTASFTTPGRYDVRVTFLKHTHRLGSVLVRMRKVA